MGPISLFAPWGESGGLTMTMGPLRRASPPPQALELLWKLHLVAAQRY